MTDREKLIELLLEIDSVCDASDCCECCEEGCYTHRAADHLIANGVTFATDTNVGGKWISVEDEMPHAEYGESDNVLTINRVGICKVLYFDGGCWCYPTGEPVSFGNPRWRITHWMPLPEPPKAQEETDGTECV